MIRGRHERRPDAACHSADVLTEPERAANSGIHPHTMPLRSQAPARQKLCWGDVATIRDVLALLRDQL